MAINDFETSEDRGQPVNLFKFIFGTGPSSFYAYTNAEQEIDHGGITYNPLPISAGAVKATTKFTESELQIEVARSSEIAQLFQGYPGGSVVSLIMRQGHAPNADDPAGWATGENFPVVWTGRVLESLPGGAVHTLVCSASGSGLNRPGLRRNYQWPCPLVLYGSRCQANKAAALRAGTVTAITGNRVTLAAGWMGANVEVDFIGGLAEWDTVDGTEFRGILRVDPGGVVVMTGPAIRLLVGDTFRAYLGCPHTLAGCGALHSNEVNYGGQPWIPTENPVNKNNHT
jgi:hypothetical protein